MTTCRHETIRVTSDQLQNSRNILAAAVRFVVDHNELHFGDFNIPSLLESSVQQWLEMADHEGGRDLWSLADEWNEIR